MPFEPIESSGEIKNLKEGNDQKLEHIDGFFHSIDRKIRVLLVRDDPAKTGEGDRIIPQMVRVIFAPIVNMEGFSFRDGGKGNPNR